MEAAAFLKNYSGPDLRLMEVCGTHTSEILKNGIPSMLPDSLRLIAGPGCPVCVTVTDYIDRLVALSREDHTTVLTFGDLMRVPGSAESLADARNTGASADYIYAPSEALVRAKANPGRLFVFAAVGFETTAPVYAMLIEEALEQGIRNLKLLTSIKTMPAAIRLVAENAKKSQRPIDGFLAPGHVCAVAGTADYETLAEELGIPFVVSGFSGKELLLALATLVALRGRGIMKNCYPAVVRPEGNPRALTAIGRTFEPVDAGWRGLGIIPQSGLKLREEFSAFDAGSAALTGDHAPAGCRCGEVLTGSILPTDCPLYGTACTPAHPVGACMVSREGSCYSYLSTIAAQPIPPPTHRVASPL